MNTTERPSDDDLHGFVGGRLDALRRQAIADWLLDHPSSAAEVRDWQNQNAALRTAFDPVLNEEIPAPLRQAAQRPRPPAGRHPRMGLAAAIGGLAIGTVVGYGLHASLATGQRPEPVPIAHSAAIAHAVYTPDVRHPVEVGAAQEAHPTQWLSKRLGAPLRVPHPSTDGYALVDGRLLPRETGPAAQLMHEGTGGKRLTLYIRTNATDNRETAFRYALEGKIGVFYWVDGRLGYALSGELTREKLLALAESTYKQLSP